MKILEPLEAAGEVLSPPVRTAILALEQHAAALEARVRELEARLGLNSTNSSLPPSSDPPGLPRRGKRPTGRTRGGQRGHPGACRSLLPPARVDAVVEHRPHSCRRCGHSLLTAASVGTLGRHQTIELPPIRAHVTEHQIVTLACPACRGRTRAAMPAEIGGKCFGPRLTALAALLLSRFRLSRRDLVAFFGDLLDVPAPALGTTQVFAQEAAQALLPTYREVRRAVRRSPSARVDETGWKLRGQSRWTWTAATDTATLFHLGRSRSARELVRLLGTGYPGVVTSDRWSAYRICQRRQLCWAHLARDFEKLALRGGDALRFARWGTAECARLFHLWGEWKKREGSRAALRRSLVPLRARLGRLLAHGGRCGDAKVAAFSRNLMSLWPSLWTFAKEEVEPTNNQAERALRRAVLWRKTSFGSASGKGLRFVERVLTLSETCRQQQVNLLDYLTRAIVAYRQNVPTPRLLPST